MNVGRKVKVARATKSAEGLLLRVIRVIRVIYKTLNQDSFCTVKVSSQGFILVLFLLNTKMKRRKVMDAVYAVLRNPNMTAEMLHR